MHNLIQSPTIAVKDAYLAFHGNILFENLNLTLKSGKWTCLLGPSGIGKSTLLRLIANLSSPGTILHADIQCDNEIALTKQIAYMAQTDLLLPWLSVLDNVLIGTRLRPCSSIDRTNTKKYAKELLAMVGLQDAEALLPHSLSGGMRQRTALVRTIIENKPVILMDEPFSALDVITKLKLQNLAAELLHGRTILFVTHDPLEALRLADDIYIMSGKPAVLHAPLKLDSPTPRDPGDSELITLQKKLFDELSKAHETSL